MNFDSVTVKKFSLGYESDIEYFTENISNSNRKPSASQYFETNNNDNNPLIVELAKVKQDHSSAVTEIQSLKTQLTSSKHQVSHFSASLQIKSEIILDLKTQITIGQDL